MKKGNRQDTRKESKDGEVERLKKKIRRLKSDKERLISEVRTLETVLEENMKYYKDKVDDDTMQEVLDNVKEFKKESGCKRCSSNVSIIERENGSIRRCKNSECRFVELNLQKP